ncbi:ABC transporter permease [Ensifer sp. 2YAB10]|jgi:putative spermidine/putrescine transport system permease protein|uniref:ABC transporter permease n=1 Tax=unclassified Ensifer TaxID=2633371 RepID=UPI001A520CD7|nr:ABC transporter permease [Ensifer sp. SSB1]MBK5571169.1 ABC transporter permease [Ensifer sp. SSB1]
MWLPAYATRSERLCRLAVVAFAFAVLVFLIGPLFVVFPLSVSKDPFFTFPIQEYSWRWYVDFFENTRWTKSLLNSLVAALFSTAIATLLGTLAALGISRPGFPARKVVMALMISPMIMPVVIVAVGAYMFFGSIGLTNTRTGLVLAHAALSIPFVVVTVLSALSTYDTNLTRAGASLGAGPVSVFFAVTLPLISPGIVSGALLAFAVSFDEVIVALFLTGAEQRTLPVQMFSGIRDQINPTIMAAASLLTTVSIALFVALSLIRSARKA